MRTLKSLVRIIVCLVAISTTFQCASSKVAEPQFEEQAPFVVKPVSFQEWYAGIKVGGTGINVFIPISKVKNDVEINDVYFRNLQGKLTKSKDQYTAILKNPSRHYTFKKAERPADFPFTLSDYDCAISYTENGQIKYYKITGLSEGAGTYYENGPPSIYVRPISTRLATVDDE